MLDRAGRTGRTDGLSTARRRMGHIDRRPRSSAHAPAPTELCSDCRIEIFIPISPIVSPIPLHSAPLHSTPSSHHGRPCVLICHACLPRGESVCTALSAVAQAQAQSTGSYEPTTSTSHTRAYRSCAPLHAHTHGGGRVERLYIRGGGTGRWVGSFVNSDWH